jgi:hypothetical protein
MKQMMVGDEYGMPPVALPKGLDRVKEESVEFDSQDEDECEDLFAGVWSPTLAMKRRRGRRFGRVREIPTEGRRVRVFHDWEKKVRRTCDTASQQG